jgi:hypothetical protein
LGAPKGKGRNITHIKGEKISTMKKRRKRRLKIECNEMREEEKVKFTLASP